MRLKLLKQLSIIAISLTSIPFNSCSCEEPASNDPAPTIKITHNSNEIQSNDTFDLISYSGNPTKIIFTIENNGQGNLNLTGNPIILLNGSDAFSVLREPIASIPANNKTDFIIHFYSKSKEIETTQVIIQTNDPDNAAISFSMKRGKTNISVYFAGPSYDRTLEKTIIEMINNQTTDEYLDICFYGLNSENVISAIENGIERGVRARFVGNLHGTEALNELKDSYYDGYFRIAKALDLKYPLESPAKRAETNYSTDASYYDFNLINQNIMHNKFILLTDNAGDKYLFTGSTNCTETGFNTNNNNSLLIRNPKIVNTYKEYFEYLLINDNKIEFNCIKHHVIDGIDIDVLFAPGSDEKSTMEYIIEKVSLARSSVNFMIFSFTHEGLLNKLLDKRNAGLTVSGIFDNSQLINSSEELLVYNGIPCRIDGNYHVVNNHGGKLHHKVMVLDSGEEDAVVITGSFNWSYNATYNNNENILIIHSKEIANLYLEEWQKRWDEGTDFNYSIENYDYAEYQEVIISEVMWMGSRKDESKAVYNDEFIELRNMTNRIIKLNGWTINKAASAGKTLYLKNCSVQPYGYLVIMRKENYDSAFMLDNCVRNSSLSVSNSALELTLKDPLKTVIDFAGNGSEGNNFAGFNGDVKKMVKKSMARKDLPGDGKEIANWFTTNTQVNINDSDSYLLYNLATPGVENLKGDLQHKTPDVTFSEIAWAGIDGYSNYEWLELFNNTDSDINLAGFRIAGDLNIHLFGIIRAGKYFLLERNKDDNSVPEKAADIIYTGILNNNGAEIKLLYNNREIDYLDMRTGWAAGSNDPKISMERIDPNLPGNNSNWQDGPGDVEGARNSAD